MDLKKDQYFNVRGKYSRFLKLYCRKCGKLLFVYQKDGAGDLLRLYYDRIFYPTNFFKNVKTRDIVCNCGEPIGAHYVYKKEKRNSIRLYQSSLKKVITKKT